MLCEQELNGIKIVYRKNIRAKLIRLVVTVDKGVLVTVPRGGTLEQATAFVKSKQDWLEKHLQLAKKRKDKKEQRLQNLPKIDLDIAQQNAFDRVAFLAEKFGFEYGNLTFRCQKAKWGSCSSNNNISLNINMLFLPQRLQDYLILHELTHTKVPNHGPKFWELLNKCTGGLAKTLTKELDTNPILVTNENIHQFHEEGAMLPNNIG